MPIAQTIEKLIRSQGFWKNVAVLISSTAVAQVIVIIAMPLITRLYSVHDIGVINLVFALLSFATPLMCMRFESALLICRTREAAGLSIACLLAIPITSVIFTCFAAMLHSNAQLGFEAIPFWSILALLIMLPGIGLFSYFRAVWLREGAVRRIGGVTMARSVGQTFGRLAGGFAGLGFTGLMIGEFLLSWSVAPFIKSRVAVKKLFERGRLSLTRVVSRYRKFPLLELPSQILNNGSLFLPIPMTAALYGIEAAGLFGLAHRLGTLPISQIARAVADVTQMQMAEAVRKKDSKKVEQLFWYVIKRLFLFALLPLLAFVLLAPILAGPVLGEKWAETGVLLALISPWLLGQTVVGPVSRILVILQRQQLKLAYDLISISFLVLTWFFASTFDLTLREYTALLSGLLALSYLPYLGLCLFALKRWKAELARNQTRLR